MSRRRVWVGSVPFTRAQREGWVRRAAAWVQSQGPRAAPYPRSRRLLPPRGRRRSRLLSRSRGGRAAGRNFLRAQWTRWRGRRVGTVPLPSPPRLLRRTGPATPRPSPPAAALTRALSGLEVARSRDVGRVSRVWWGYGAGGRTVWAGVGPGRRRSGAALVTSGPPSRACTGAPRGRLGAGTRHRGRARGPTR